MEGPLKFWGNGGIEEPVEDQFKEYDYPIAKEDGGTEIHMMWTDTPCRITCWNCGNETIEAQRSPKIEFILAQHPWLENDCLYADVILPGNTTMEVEDIVTNTRQGIQHHSIQLQEQAVKPVGESMTDYEMVYEIAKRFGKGEEFSEGKTTAGSAAGGLRQHEPGQLRELGRVRRRSSMSCCRLPRAGKRTRSGLRPFYDDPEQNPLPTPTGKLEFYSAALAENFPDDEERPPIPKWIEKGITHDENLVSYRAKKYPLLLMSNHPRHRVHAQADDISWSREIVTCKVKCWDGYMYEPCWIHPQDAEARGILMGDIVAVENERGIVLCGARVWERIMPGVIYVDHGARHDPIIPGKVDRGGAINSISPAGIISKRCVGQATSNYLVELSKVSTAMMDQWRREYPDAFERDYDPASGLRFDGWVIGGNE